MNQFEVSKEIRKIYLKPPTLEQTLSFIEELGISDAQFERFYRMGKGMMKQVRTNRKPLPVMMWAIVFEKIVPQYGMNCTEINQLLLRRTKSVTKIVTKSVPKLSPESQTHNRITKIA